MGRGATKATGNVWYEARIEAARYNEKLCSREGAAELLDMSVSAISDMELDITKFMPVDKAVRVADLYKAPQLRNYYCKNVCPIGKNKPVAVELDTIELVTVRLLKALQTEAVEDIRRKLLEIAEDGVVSEDEVVDLDAVTDCLNNLAKQISSLQIILSIVKGQHDGD